MDKSVALVEKDLSEVSELEKIVKNEDAVVSEKTKQADIIRQVKMCQLCELSCSPGLPGGAGRGDGHRGSCPGGPGQSHPARLWRSESNQATNSIHKAVHGGNLRAQVRQTKVW